MKPPTSKRNRIIQIDVTSLCDKACSNCTRALAQIRKPDMSLEQFEAAVLACKDWILREKGILSLFGGNPCISKNFEGYCEILAAHLPTSRRGLWTNNLLGKGAIARRYFDESSMFNFNVHRDAKAAAEIREHFPWARVFGVDKPSIHSSIFLASSDYITEAEMWQKVSQCSYDTHWSAIVVQEAPDWDQLGGYSCEIASTHARVRGQALGVPVVAGWLDCTVDDVRHQYQFACPKCSGCLGVAGIEDLARPIDQFSPSNADLVQLNWAKNRTAEVIVTPSAEKRLPIEYLK